MTVMDRNKVIVVDKYDHPLGEMDKLEAHTTGTLHRAFSVFIFNSDGEMLIHQRAAGKYHGGGLWTNACCSHPQPGEDIMESARARLNDEMGIDCLLHKAFTFIYNSPVENGLTEHEYDHVFIGYTDQIPEPDPLEVQHFYWMQIEPLREFIREHEEMFTVWFRMAFERVVEHIQVL